MPVGTNLERRGAVYYWRRRIPPRLVKAGGRSHLRMSLRTKEPAQARALAARLDATAMEVFMSDDAPALSQQQLEAIFQQVLRDHARKLDTIRAMELRDGLTDPDVLAREDHAAGLAYTIVARRGAAATVTTAERRRLAAAGEAETMIDDVTTLLAEMRRNGQTNASIGRLKALIEAVGALATPANVAVAERAYLRALGEALLGSAAASNAGLAQTVAIVPQAPVETSPAAAVVEASAVVAEPQRDVPSAVAGAGQRSIASAPSAHHPIDGPVGAGLDDGRQGGELISREPGRMPLRADVLQPVGAAFVEPVNPVAQRLAIHAADPRGLLPIHPIENRRQRQKPSALVGVPRPRREPSQVEGRVVRSKLHRSSHGANPPRIHGISETSRRKDPVSQPHRPLV